MSVNARGSLLMAVQPEWLGEDAGVSVLDGAIRADGETVPFFAEDIVPLLPQAGAKVTLFSSRECKDDAAFAAYFTARAAEAGCSVEAMRRLLVAGAPRVDGDIESMAVGTGASTSSFCLCKASDAGGGWNGAVAPAIVRDASFFDVAALDTARDYLGRAGSSASEKALLKLLLRCTHSEHDFRAKVAAISAGDASGGAGCNGYFNVAGNRRVPSTTKPRGSSGAAAFELLAELTSSADIRVGMPHIVTVVDGRRAVCELALTAALWAPFFANHPQDREEDAGLRSCVVVTRFYRLALTSTASNDAQELNAAELGLKVYEVLKLGGANKVRKLLDDGAELEDLRKSASGVMSAMGEYSVGMGGGMGGGVRWIGGGGGGVGAGCGGGARAVSNTLSPSSPRPYHLPRSQSTCTTSWPTARRAARTRWAPSSS
jgi:hypothetical protein